MTQSIILTGPQLLAGRSFTVVTPSFPSSSHSLAFTSHIDNFILLRRSNRPIIPIRASADESTNLDVTTGTLYDLLGISTIATMPKIKQAYRKLAQKYHPDVSPPEKVEEHTRQFLRVHEAYETLSDYETRAKYDRDLACGCHLGSSTGKQFDKQIWEIQPEEPQEPEALQNWMHRKKHKKFLSWAERVRMKHRSSSESSDD
ncbi:Chaperone protein dnaJ 20, chloroplastic [Linum perenne]